MRGSTLDVRVLRGAGIDSDSDVNRRQILTLTSKVHPRAVRVKTTLCQRLVFAGYKCVTVFMPRRIIMCTTNVLYNLAIVMAYHTA